MTNLTCQSCPQFCQTCYAGGCLTCINGYFLTSNLTCSVNCVVPCATCTNSTNCSSCIAGYTYNSSSKTCVPQTNCFGTCTVCPIGYVLQLGYCIQCNSTNCQICNISNINQCLSCVQGYYLNSTQNRCSPCLTSCATCLREDGCLTCASGYTSLYLNEIQSFGYECLKCSFPCATCSSTTTNCQSCVSNYTLNGWKCIQNFFFSFNLTLFTNISTFNQNYMSFVQLLLNAIGSSNANSLTITTITFGSVQVQGKVTPSAPSGSEQASQQYNSLKNTLSTSNSIAGMQVGSSSISVNGGSIPDDNSSNSNLGLILGISIPVGVLLIAGGILLIYCKKKKSKTVIEIPMRESNFSGIKEPLT